MINPNTPTIVRWHIYKDEAPHFNIFKPNSDLKEDWPHILRDHVLNNWQPGLLPDEIHIFTFEDMLEHLIVSKYSSMRVDVD